MSLFGSLFGLSKDNKDVRQKTILDLVVYTTGLVSNSRKIDPLIDRVRRITATLAPGQELSQKDVDALIDIYLKIEQYLIANEALRSFTKLELRSRIDPELLKDIIQHEAEIN